MEKTTYVIGHKNPDTDSVVAAAAYAALKRALGLKGAVAARAGAVNPQTEYIFHRFNATLPEFIPDLVPKVEYYLGEPPVCVDEMMPLWEALSVMESANRQVLPIVDKTGRYKAMLHYSAFAQNILTKINPRHKAVIPTSLHHLIETIKAQPLVIFDRDTVFNARMVVAALSTEKFHDYIHAEPADNKIVLVGDREEAQRIAVEAGAKAIIITNGILPSKEVKELAEKKGVSILTSPYDTSSTALLVLYSAPVITVADGGIAPLSRRDWIKTAKQAIAKSPSRSVPVVDDDGKVIGLFTEGDLIKEANIEVIMVDHNEFSQAVEGIDHYRIQEVIDHHRLGSFSTPYPITFINKVVGSTSTIVASMFRETRTPLTKQLASILLCGILSDTLVLKSATTTDVDRDMAEYLASITDLSIEEVGLDIMTSASEAARLPVDKMVRVDRKEYLASGKKLSVGQIELTSTAEIMERSDEVLLGLKQLRGEMGCYLASLMATDITKLESILFLDAESELYNYVNYPSPKKGIYMLKDVLSRKKQLMPALFEMVEKAQER
ncbi:MAG: putative manganese-dependent inorganic diphosphatase [Rectinemataceae bacterium]|nr:putative manganese-dependent inorganic diphosphatase [Rectinemataceae bacterium]